MKLISLISLFSLIACAPSKIVTNAPSSYTIETSKPFDETWTNVIDYLSKAGTTIKTIDKASGIIITDEYSLMNSYTFEDKDGKLKDPTAYVVLNKIKGGFGNTLKPEYVHGNYNVRVKSSGSGSTITVNLVNLKAAVASRNAYGGIIGWHYYTVKSTNVFEKQMAEILK